MSPTAPRPDTPRSITADAGEVAGPVDSELAVSGWDRYEVGRLLGEGGMGAVYLARDRRLDRDVALKFIRGGDARRTQRLAQEARAQARIAHPNVCKVHEVGEVKGRAYIAMELIAGRPLSELVNELTLHEKVQIVRDVALGLHEAHTQGILHRDVKPANILVERTDSHLHAVIMDFGLAREENDARGLTETGVILGTPGYMSPEQLRGEARNVDRRSDVYALGATLYELLCGQVPFRSSGTADALLKVLHEEPTAPRALVASVPEDLEVITLKCLAKEPSRRYDSARALAEDLDRYIRGEPILARKASLGYRLRRQLRRHRALVVVAALALIAVGVVGGAALRARAQASRQAAELEERAHLAQELAREFQQLEWYMRTAYGLPLHDIGEDEKRLRDRMTAIEREMATYGSWGRVLAHFALGRGYLTLHRYDEAHDHLQQALAAGYDAPEVHYALGIVLGKLFHRAMTAARNGGNPEWLARRREELARQYLTPALASIEKSRALRLEAPSYLDALVAFYRDDLDGALALARRAETEAPWFYEARQLEGDVLYERGNALQNRGLAAEADTFFAQAATAYDAAAAIGRSDADLYLGSADAWMRRTMGNAVGGPSQEDKLAKVLERCGQATAAAPTRGEPYVTLAHAHIALSSQMADGGKDPQPELDRVVAAAQRAIELDPRLFAAHQALADAQAMSAYMALRRGEDPRAVMDAAIASATRAEKLEPQHPGGKLALANTLMLRVEYNARVGLDVEADLKALIASARECQRLDPPYTMCYLGELMGLGKLTDYLRRHGRSDATLLGRGAAAYAACMKTTARASRCDAGYGALRAVEAERLHDAGEAYEATLAGARADLDRSLSVEPNSAWVRENQASAALIAARGGSAEALADAERVIAACLALAPQDSACSILDARRALLLAELGRAPLDRALTAATLATTRDARSVDAIAVLAETHRLLAVASEKTRAQHLEAGLAACARGLAQDPNHAELLAVQGELLLGAARAGDATAAARARDSFARALAENPLLERRHGAGIEDAKQLAPTVK